MSEAEFQAFLTTALQNGAVHLEDGAIANVCMDWRHIGEALAACKAAFDEYKQMCDWNKQTAGMGTFYRSQHELILVSKKGKGPHTNNFKLGQHGRHRTNVWGYPGLSGFGSERDEQLAMHSTVKPVAMISDAILDVSKRGDIVLDMFGGSGSTLVAAERTGRVARIMELDPGYCDIIAGRFEKLTGTAAIHLTSGMRFSELRRARYGWGAAA